MSNAVVANLSHLRQTRWLRIPMPVSRADTLPQHCIVDGRYLATKAERLADHTQMWAVRMDLGGHVSGAVLQWDPWPAGVPFPPHQLTDWVTDRVEATKLTVDIEGFDGVVSQSLPLEFAAVEFECDAVHVWRLECHREGWHATAYVHLWSGQDVVDIELRVVWSDTRHASMRPGEAIITLRSGGEPITSWNGRRCQASHVAVNKVRIYEDEVVDGYPILWRGVMGALPDNLEGADEARTRNVWAAHAGPAVGTYQWPDGEWLAFGARPYVPPEDHKGRWLAYEDGYGDYHDQRPLALELRPGGTGDQSPFGATNALPAAGGAVWQIPLLLHAASDPRAVHHYELDGTPITRATHPEWETWECLTELRQSPNRLGKSVDQPAGWETIGGRYVGVDDQHEGSGPLLAAYALTGSYLLRDEILRRIDCHEARAFPARWRASNPASWLDAPRATGRLWQFWAKAMTLFDGRTRERLSVMALKELKMWSAYRATLPAGPIKLWRISDPRVIADGRPAHMPWQDAIYTMGALEIHCARRRLGLAGPEDVFLAEAVNIGRQIIEHAVVTASWGAMLPITALAATASGQAQDASYYQYPRQGAGTTPLPGNDLMVADGFGWWAWYAGAVAAMLHGPQDDVYDRARMIYDGHGPHSFGADREWIEWWAMPGGEQ